MTYDFLLVMAAQKLMPETGPDLLEAAPPPEPPQPKVVDPIIDHAPQLSVRRFGVEQAGRDDEPEA